MNEIIYRKNSITNADIVTGNCLLSHAMTGDTLAADTLDFRVWSDTGLGKVDGDFFTADEKTITTKDGKVFRCFVEKDLTDFVAGDRSNTSGMGNWSVNSTFVTLSGRINFTTSLAYRPSGFLATRCTTAVSTRAKRLQRWQQKYWRVYRTR